MTFCHFSKGANFCHYLFASLGDETLPKKGQGCHGQGKKYLENEIFSRNFVDGQGNLERTWKVGEFENKWLWQAVFRKFVYSVQEGKGCSVR